MKIQTAKEIVEGLQRELAALCVSATKGSASAEKFLDESQFIAFELVRVTAELDAVHALLVEELRGGKDSASPELVISLNEVEAEIVGLLSRLGAKIPTSPQPPSVGSPDYKAAVEAVAAGRNLA